ncbi:frizzled-4 [Stomoxys calcitrans]|uniref:Frizzled-4 n=1 Tax=Stomoxys calcitrans TaxID=35570 RepID=A0A1I8PC41_STOCA|nr:frizzled-4 [Stomoxys calcitrans]
MFTNVPNMERFFILVLIFVPVGKYVTAINEYDRQCEPIRIELCRNIGYNETSMPNLAGNEIQSEAEYTLQSFAPLIDYVCSSQLKLFLCATYVPMCTPKAPVPIGPCRTLCESVRSRCDPVLQGFGYHWPPALDCSRFPKENNQETMCMEGPGEVLETHSVGDTYSAHTPAKVNPQQTIEASVPVLECPGRSKLYVKLHRSFRCAPLCHATILFGPNEKHKAEIWANTWTYTALGLGLLAVACLFAETNAFNTSEAQTTRVLPPLMWSHIMVVIGWTVRFVAGRTATSCGFDPQLPNVSLLLVDGLSNGTCAATFLLRYYFGMTAAAWWAILCLGWHRDVRRNSPDSVNSFPYSSTNISNTTTKSYRGNMYKMGSSITTSNLARFLAWGLPAFQTAAVIVGRIIDADELLGICFVGNQSEKGLQILVATPLFCYWIFGAMNLASGYLVHRRNKEIVRSTNSTTLQIIMQNKCSISGSFLFIYCVPFAVLLLAVIYEFANIDVWINLSPYIMPNRSNVALNGETPMWPFMTKTFMELSLPIICSAWILVPKVSSMYKSHVAKTAPKTSAISSPPPTSQSFAGTNNSSCRTTSKAYSTVSYHSVRQPKNPPITPTKSHKNYGIVLKHHPNSSLGHNKYVPKHSAHFYMSSTGKKGANAVHHYGDETIL